MRAQPAIAALALLLAAAEAQELRQIDCPRFASACYDPFRQRVVAPSIGGYTLEWDGAVWRQAPDIGAPGGFCYVDRSTTWPCAVTRTFVGAGMQLGLWQRRGSAWQTVSTPTAPPLRNDIALCYDAARDELLGFGGFLPATLTPLGDTWVWDGTSWSLRLVAGPPSRGRATLAFDSTRQRVVLFGGYLHPSQTSPFDDTWEWDGTAWTQVATPTRPAPRLRAGAAYDSMRQRVVMIGSADTPGYPVEHWEYDGATWTQGPAPPPATSRLPVVVYDDARGETLLLGGDDLSGVHGRVWAWDGSVWSQRPGFGELPYQSYGTEIAPELSGSGIYMFGPYDTGMPGNTDELWTFDGTTWSLTATGGPPARSDPAFWSMQSGAYVFGGYVGAGLANDLWRWNGGAWSQLTPPVSPPPRMRAACTVDTIADRAIVFGGYNGAGWSNDTWIFDGSQWSQAPAGPSPTPRYFAAMAFDPIRDRVVLFGGIGGPSGTTPLTDTWQWDGATWLQTVTAQAPPSGGRMAFDPVSQSLLCFAPSPGPGQEYQVWSFDGFGWTLLPMPGTAGSANALRASLPRPVTTATGDVVVVDQTSGAIALLPTPARTAHYGSSCGNDAPVLTAASLPRVPEAAFALDVTRAPANGPVAIAAAEASAAVPFFGCTLLVTPGISTLFVTASPTGHAMRPLVIPNMPVLVGASAFFQAATLTAANPNGFALSEGLRVDLGQ